MYDSWFTMGLAVVNPSLVTTTLANTIQASGPPFKFVQRIVCEIDSGGKLASFTAPQTGVLVNGPTTAVRDAIADFAKKNSTAPPPVGIYCAGRFSQYMAISQFASANANSKFSDIIALANKGLTAALAGAAPSTRAAFLAFLGLCMLDGQFSADLKGARQAALTADFGLTGQELQVAMAFVATNEFGVATNLLMGSDLDPWEQLSSEQIIFWDNFNEHSIP